MKEATLNVVTVTSRARKPPKVESSAEARIAVGAEKAILQAGRRRLRPIVMTALATVAGMLPLAFAIGAGSQMLQPLAIAVIGGVLISMVLSLIITPAVHFYLSRKGESSEVEPVPVLE